MRLAVFHQEVFDLLCIQQASDLVDAHVGPNGLVFAQHLRPEAGCRLASGEVGAVHTRLGNDNIVVGWAGVQGGGDLIKDRGAVLDVCGVRQYPAGTISWRLELQLI